MKFLPQEIIRRKRDGHALSSDEISQIVGGLTDGSLAEGQAAAFAMAVYFQGMTMEERVALTRSMQQSGQTLSWDPRDRSPVLDKHSTGGVGDKVSLILAPLVAACGARVPMISGRGLGHTGGTRDKMEAIPGYQTAPSIAMLHDCIAEAGCAMIGQTGDLAPADRRLYAIRDMTATVESTPLITASILSKKLAAGLDGLVLNVTTGNGAVAAELSMARDVANSIVAVARGAGLQTTAVITDMNQVLGRNAGNAVEVQESVDFLLRPQSREPRLHEVVITLAGEMLAIGKLAEDHTAGEKLALAALNSDRPAAIFQRMIAALGGPADFVAKAAEYLPVAPVRKACWPDRPGVVLSMDTRALGLAIVALGGGRRRVEDVIDHSVGLTDVCGPGDAVNRDRPLAIVHAANDDDAETACRALRDAIHVGDQATEKLPVIIERIAGD